MNVLRPLSIALAVCLLVTAGCGQRRVGWLLTYKIDRDKLPAGAAVDMPGLLRAIERRVNPGWSNRAKVTQVGEEFRIDVFGESDDPATVDEIELIMASTCELEFHIAANRHDHPEIIERAEASSERLVVDGQQHPIARWVPVVAEGQPRGAGLIERETAGNPTEVLVVLGPYDISGRDLQSASASTDDSGRPLVLFDVKADRVGRFAHLTGDNLPDPVLGLKRQLAIILDGKLLSAPTINTVISDRGSITGNFSQQEVERMTAVLRAGAFPAPLKLVSRVSAWGG